MASEPLSAGPAPILRWLLRRSQVGQIAPEYKVTRPSNSLLPFSLYWALLRRLDQADEPVLAYDISDEALETTAGFEKAGKYTFYFCTALDLCPGP